MHTLFPKRHRLRMKSPPIFALNIGFATTILVFIPSYYFCVKKRDYKEHLIEFMMNANEFEKASAMPPQVPAGEEHPFLDPAAVATANAKGNANANSASGDAAQSDAPGTATVADREFVGHLPEKKEWQMPVSQQDAKDVFAEKKQ